MKKLVLITLALLLVSAASAQSPRRYVLRSLLVPGWGELSAGSSSGYAFIVSEILCWGGYFYYGEVQQEKDRESYQFARKYAGIPAGANDEYYLNLIGKYNTSGYGPWGYADDMLRRAQAQYGPNAEIEPDIYMTDLAWNWPDKQTRVRYKSMRKDADISADYQTVAAGVIVLNHLLSALNSYRVYNGSIRMHAQAGFIGDISTPALQMRFDF